MNFRCYLVEEDPLIVGGWVYVGLLQDPTYVNFDTITPKSLIDNAIEITNRDSYSVVLGENRLIYILYRGTHKPSQVTLTSLGFTTTLSYEDLVNLEMWHQRNDVIVDGIQYSCICLGISTGNNSDLFEINF